MTSFKTYRLEEICDIQIGKTPRRENRTYWGKGFPWVSISDIKSREIVHTKEQITKEAVEESGCKLIPKGTLLLSFKLSIGKMAFAGTDLYTNEAIAALLIKKPAEIHPWYLFYALRNTRLVGANNAAMGATLNKESLKAIRLPIPDKFEDQLHIVNVLSKADELVAQRNETILLLDEFLKSSFLNMFGDPSSNKKKFPVGTIRDLVTEVKYGTSKSSGLDGKYPYLRMNNIS
ncbi:MAG: restriction endonuclease subunit S, partial [Bacteroidota bacterium]